MKVGLLFTKKRANFRFKMGFFLYYQVTLWGDYSN